MTINPETRESLILRLPSAADAQAWREFVDLYEPLIIRFSKRRGLQDADAREIAQNVLISVAKAVDRWEPACYLCRRLSQSFDQERLSAPAKFFSKGLIVVVARHTDQLKSVACS